MDDYEILKLTHPDDLPYVLTQADLDLQWRALISALGFAERLLWVIMFDDLGRMLPTVSHIADLPDVPDDDFLNTLTNTYGHLLEVYAPGGRIAFLVSRPGRAGITPFDRAWATGLDLAARRLGIDAHAVHLANDEEVRVFALDDLMSS